VKKALVIGLLLGLFSLSAMAAESGNYPKTEVFGGYQYTYLEGGANANGFDFAFNGNFNDYFGIAADFGAAYTSQGGINLNNYTYTFGPVLSLRAHKAYTPFVHALVGGDHSTASASGYGSLGSGNGMALMAGGGVDINFNKFMAFRGSADWMMVHGNGNTSAKNFRMPIGIVFKF
jgi:hypothetical protein